MLHYSSRCAKLFPTLFTWILLLGMYKKIMLKKNNFNSRCQNLILDFFLYFMLYLIFYPRIVSGLSS